MLLRRAALDAALDQARPLVGEEVGMTVPERATRARYIPRCVLARFCTLKHSHSDIRPCQNRAVRVPYSAARLATSLSSVEVCNDMGRRPYRYLMIFKPQYSCTVHR